MTTTTLNTTQTTTKPQTTPEEKALPPVPRKGYWAFCDDQQRNRYFWFALPALALPCVFMPPAIYAMLTYGGAGFSIFLFVSMLLFICGMVANVGGQTTRVTITLFLLGVIWNIAFPLFSLFCIS